MPSPMIRLPRVVKQFDGRRQVIALDGIDLEIAKGEMVSIIGPSGSGKSTLLNLVGGLDRPTSGEVALDGEVAGLSDDALTRVRRDKIGFIFQFFNLLPTLIVPRERRPAAAPARLAAHEGRRARARAARRSCSSDTACSICPRSCRAASASASRSPARCRSIRRSCSPTSRPATSTRSTGEEILDADSRSARPPRLDGASSSRTT